MERDLLARPWTKSALALCLAVSLWSAGCGSSPAPPPSPSPSKASPSKSPSPSPSASASPTPVPQYTGPEHTPGDYGPVVRQSLSEYDVLKRKGVDLALGKGWDKALPLLSQAAEQNPDDAEVQFYLMLSKGNLEEGPSVHSEAYFHAKNVIDLAPDSTEATRALDYLAAAESEALLKGEAIPAMTVTVASGSPSPSPSLSPGASKSPTPSKSPSPSKSPPGGTGKSPYAPTKEPALANEEIFVVTPGQAVQLPEAIRSQDSMINQLSEQIQKRIWQTEVYPKAAQPVREMPKGAKVKLQDAQVFYYNIASWRGPVVYAEDEDRNIVYDGNTYRVGAVHIVVTEPDGREVRSWMVNHLERMQPDGTWKVLIGNRLKLQRGIPER